MAIFFIMDKWNITHLNAFYCQVLSESTARLWRKREFRRAQSSELSKDRKAQKMFLG